MNGLLAVMRKEFRHVLRDPYTLIGMTLGTVLLMALMAYAVSADIEHIPIVLVDGDLTPQSRAYAQRFLTERFFDVRGWAQSHAEALAWVQAGRVRGAVVIPAGFAAALQEGRGAPVQIVVDGSEPNIALQIVGNAESLSAGFSATLMEQGATALAPLEFRVQTLYNPTLRELNSFLPGLIAMVLAFPALSAGLSLVREREHGSLEGLLSTPIQRVQLLAGKGAPYLLIGMVDILILTGVGVFLFNVPFRGRLFDLLMFSTFFLLANLGVGLLVASLLRTQTAVLIVGGLIFMLPLTQSGLLTPLYAMPPDAQMQAMVWPATHYIIIARGIFLKGIGLGALAFHGFFLLASGLALNGLAVWRFRKKL